jgi:uncharacterized protein YecT (DUF1311 family)
MMRLLRTLALCLLIAGPALAQDDTGIACNPEGTQIELNACAQQEYDDADATLNHTWRRLAEALADQPVALAALRRSQRAWIAFRDAEVDAHFPVADGEDPRFVYGSMYPMSRSAVLTRLTRDRTAQLRAHLEEFEAR